MSRVFVARDSSLGRDVVVKVLSPELAYALSAERFTREIRLAAALQEPHIVPVLSAGQTEGGLPYYTMPFVRGESLRQRIKQGPVALEESLAKENGYTVVEKILYPAKSTQLTSEVQRIKAGGADVVMQSSYLGDAVLAMKTYKDLGYTPKALLANDAGFNDSEFLRTLGKDGETILSGKIPAPAGSHTFLATVHKYSDEAKEKQGE